MGKFLSAQQHIEIGDPTYGIINAPGNQALSLNVNDGKAIKIKTWNQGITAFELENTGLGTGGTFFKVLGNGQTQIGAKTQQTGTAHAGALLTVYGKIVGTEIIVTQQNWADYVFSSKYKLPTWEETSNYFKANNHLMNVPSAQEIKENGVNIGETQKVMMEKIEEAYLYIGELHDAVKKLKKENELLNEKLKKLEKK